MRKYNGSYVSLGKEPTKLNTVSRTTFKDNYHASRDLNNFDRSYIQTIKQVNWSLADAAVAHPTN